MSYKDPAAKRQRERERRAKFTPEQKAAALQHSLLYMQHRRLTDATYLAKVRDNNRKFYKQYREKRVAAMREKQWRTRVQCLQAYSPGKLACACCEEDTLEFLTLDHVKDRKRDGGVRVGGDRSGQTLISWLIRMNFPPGFQVLCYNCNCSRSKYDRCPHERAREIQDMAV